MRRYLVQIQGSAIPPIRLNKTKNGRPEAIRHNRDPFERCPEGEGRCPASGSGSYRKRNPMRKVALALIVLMLTDRATSHRAAALGVLALLLAGACSLPGTGSAKSPSPLASSSRTSPPLASPSQSPFPVALASAYGVLMSPLSSTNYTVSLVGIDGRVVASQLASSPGTIDCGGAAALLPAPVSTSNTRVYFMDALGVVRYLAPNGDAGQTITDRKSVV